MSLKDEINIRIKNEITKDPYHLGYSVMTDEQIKEAMNNSFAIVVSSEIVVAPPICRILAGLESAPNAVLDTQEVTDAKKL